MHDLSPLRLMNTLFAAIGISALYGAASYLFVGWSDGNRAASEFAVAFMRSYNTLISLGLILGSTIIVYRSQWLIPRAIEKALDDDKTLWPRDYVFYSLRFADRTRSLMIVAVYSTIGFAIFSVCRFKISPIADLAMMLSACAQYGMGVYVGRKICYAGMMLQSLLRLDIRKNLFRERALDVINTYVHIVSTLTIIFVYIHVRGYYNGPFAFDTSIRDGPRTLLILPAFVATPVLLTFTFYSRAVVSRIYNRSIDVEIDRLQTVVQSENFTNFEKRSYLIEVDKMARDELRYSLQLTLSDLPIAITVAVMVLEPLFGR